MQSCLTLCNPMDCSKPGFPVHHQLPELTQTHVCQVSDAIQPSHPLSSPSPHAFILSSIRIFSSESVLCIRWPKYWSFSFSISPSNEYSGLISSRIDKFDLLAVQGTLKSLLHHHSSKASVLWCSAFFMVQFSHLYMAAGKTIPLTILNMLSRFVTAFSSKEQVSFNFMAAVTVHRDFGAKEIKSVTISIFRPPISHEVMRLNAMICFF